MVVDENNPDGVRSHNLDDKSAPRPAPDANERVTDG